MSFSIPRFYAILDAAQIGDRSAATICGLLLAAGVRLIQYRDKSASSRELYETCYRLDEQVHCAAGIFIVNDRADIARAVGADGVHLGQEDLPVELARRVLEPGKWVGYSTHRLDQVREADRSSADYIAFGPIFPTQSKAKPDPVVGLDGLWQARQGTSKPLVAIGGITLENARQVIEAGADSVAVIADLLKAPDVGQRAKQFLHALGNS
jgi:thiamine-phosphate pyrophosphorylase